jgi:hypothetical protein
MLMVRVLSLAAVAAAVAMLDFAGTAGATQVPKLIGTVGRNGAFTITLTNPRGRIVKSLKAGTYRLVIHDDSPLHNFELDGPNDRSWDFTDVSFVGTKTRTVKLTRGAYKAYCSPHEETMFQRFTVR